MMTSFSASNFRRSSKAGLGSEAASWGLEALLRFALFRVTASCPAVRSDISPSLTLVVKSS